MRELPDGRLVAVDLRERRIVLLDLARGTAREVGREGQGPRRHRRALRRTRRHLHATDYRVEILRDGRRVVEGPRVAYTPLAVGRDERDAFRDDAIRRPRGSITVSGAKGKPLQGTERDAARREIDIPDDAFPSHMSPIVDERATLVDPADRIWVARTWAASSTDGLFDVFNDRAELVARVTLRNRGRVVGFGKSSVYVFTPDDDDVEWIERYAMPAIR